MKNQHKQKRFWEHNLNGITGLRMPTGQSKFSVFVSDISFAEQQTNAFSRK